MSSPLPRRPLTVIFTLLLGLTSFGVAGCPGDLDPRVMMTGPTPPCDAPSMVFSRPPNNGLCATLGCHDATSMQGGLNLTNDAGLVTRLLGVLPSGTNASVCAGTTTPYLVAGSQPATGLLLDKMFAPTLPCGGLGNRMPSLGTLTQADMVCITSWANDVTKP